MTAQLNADPPVPNQDLHKLFAAYWEFRMRREPERATYLGDHRFDDRVYDYSQAARDTEDSFYRSLQERLNKIPRKELSNSDRLNAALLQHTLDDFFTMLPFPEHLMPIKQQDSFQITLGLLQQYHKFDTAADCKNYAQRMQAVKTQVHDMIADMDDGIKKGVVRPKIIIEQAIPQFDALITSDPEKNPLYPAALISSKTIGDADKKDVAVSVASAIEAMTKLRDYLKETYLPKCRDTVGYCFLPEGKEWYKAAARVQTTTDQTPEALHELGLDELRRIHAEMLKIAKEVGFSGGLRPFIDKIRTDPAMYNKTPEEILRRHAEILKRSDANLPKVFGVLPKIPYELKEMEKFRCEAAPEAYYYNAPDDGSRPAYFYVNTCQPKTRPIFTMEALAYHEAQPGHHFQLALAQEHKEWPMFRRFESINAYIEGWALYSEVLGFDLGGYRDPYSRFGQLTFDAWRSSRLVVDTGMHYLGWSRQRAIDFMKANTALSEQNIISEVDRYIAWPGQALAYKVGQLEILKLRKEAETALGPKFDIRAFHDHLLADGSQPMDLLGLRMRAWIQSQAKKK
jgi:prolyl oligopeptidase